MSSTSTPAPVSTASACIPNIGRSGRRLRYGGAAVAVIVGLVGAVRIVWLGMPPVAMAGPALAFLAAALGWFQAREKT